MTNDIERLANLIEKRTREIMARNPHLDSLAKIYYEEIAIEYAQEFKEAGYIHKSQAIEYVESCRQCGGWCRSGVPSSPCGKCKGSGIVLRKDK